MRIETWGGLKTRVLGGRDARGEGDGPVVLFLHGFGAPGDDLVPLGAELARGVPALATARFVFPEAPLALPAGFGAGRAWWMIDMERLQRASFSGSYEAMTRDVPAGLAEARARVLALLDDVERHLGVKSGRVVLGGFSQGAMLSLDAALHDRRPLAGLALLSGSLIAEGEWTPRLADRSGLPVFMSHGAFDPILPIALAQRLRERLEAAGLATEFVDFRGAHEIPRPVLAGLGRFLERVLREP
jgi:phospholipase/carboxylesterase